MAIGDRKDGKLIRDLDSLHYITGIIYPNRCDNEAFISERIDLTNLDKYLQDKNSTNPIYKYNLFQATITALLRVITLRDKMNRFIVNGNFYQRNEISTAFVVKKIVKDERSSEMLAFVKAKKDDNFETIHNEIYRQVSAVRTGKTDASTDSMNHFNKLPRGLSKALIHFIMWLDKYGKVPSFLIKTDPYYSSCVVSNLGSLKMNSGYHHLTNWGTCSMIVLIGEIKLHQFINDDGKEEMRNSVDIGITIDERIADGAYYAKTIKMLKKILENPYLLEENMDKEIEI